MGADARLFLFDYEIYRSEVLPAFLRLMRDSSIDTWLMELHRLHTDGLGIDECLARHSVSLAPVDILKHCTYLDPDLAVRTVRSDPQSLYDCGWETRACRSADCSVRDQCPFHFVEEPQQTITVDYLLRLFQMAVADRCLGPGQFLGRSIDCFFYWKTLDELGVAPADPIHLLLQQLGRRGFRRSRFGEFFNIVYQSVHFDLFIKRRNISHRAHLAEYFVSLAGPSLHELENILHRIFTVLVHIEHF